MTEIERLKTLLFRCKEYIEEMEVTVDGEWGSCRRLDKIIADDEMPELYKDVCNRLMELVRDA